MQPAYQCLRRYVCYLLFLFLLLFFWWREQTALILVEPQHRRGHLVVFGAASMTPHGNAPGWPTLAWQWLKRPKLDPLQMISENKSVTGFNLIWLWDMAGALSPILEDMMQSVQWQPPHVGHTFAFDKAQVCIYMCVSSLSLAFTITVHSYTYASCRKPHARCNRVAQQGKYVYKK